MMIPTTQQKDEWNGSKNKKKTSGIAMKSHFNSSNYSFHVFKWNYGFSENTTIFQPQLEFIKES